MTTPNQSDVQQAVNYLKESNEAFDAKVSALQVAAETGDFTVMDILNEYADSVSISNVVYPSFVQQLEELRRAFERESGGSNLPPLEEITSNFELIRTEQDIIDQAVSIYNASNISQEERRDALETLIKDAQRSGVDIDPAVVVETIKQGGAQDSSQPIVSDEVQSSESIEDESSIQIPSNIEAGDEIVYSVDLPNDADVERIDWYVGGTLEGHGKTLLHEFDFPGVYSLAVEVISTSDEHTYISEEVEVTGRTEIDVDIIGNTKVVTGNESRFVADVTVHNTRVERVTWELDSVVIGEGKQVTHQFDSPGEYTLSVTVEAEDDDVSAIESETITVESSTDIDIDITAPDAVRVGEQVEIGYVVETENSYMNTLECSINGSQIDFNEVPDSSLTHTFSEPGNYEIVFRAVNNAGDSVKQTIMIPCHAEPEVELVNSPEEVVLGDVVELQADFDESLSSRWEVENASLTAVGDQSARVEFDSAGSQIAVVTVEVENELGDIVSESVEIFVNEPEIEPVIEYTKGLIAGDKAEFTVESSTVQHDNISDVMWKLKDGTEIGSGETIVHAFESPGKYTVGATISTERGLEQTDSVVVTVSPDTDVTAVIVVSGGPSTRDSFKFDGSKSVAKETEIEAYTWLVDNEELGTGENVETTFDTPGEYDVQLVVRTKTGDTDTVKEVVSVEEYTEVTANISGPSEVIVGERGLFTADQSSCLNTEISEYQWFLNEKPVAGDETFKQTFDRTGHYSVAVKVTTVDGDTDRDSCSVTVIEDEPDIVVDVDTSDNCVVEEPVEFKTSISTSDDVTVTNHVWEFGDGEVRDGVPAVTRGFSEYGPIDVQVTVETNIDLTETVSETVYILPNPDNPPYSEVRDETTVEEVLSEALAIYSDERLPNDEKDRFVELLLLDAEHADLDVTKDDVRDYVADAETSVPIIPFEVEDTETEQGVTESLGDEWSIDSPSVTEDDEVSEVERSIGVDGLDERSGDASETNQKASAIDSDLDGWSMSDGRVDGEAMTSDGDNIPSTPGGSDSDSSEILPTDVDVDAILSESDGHTQERIPPEQFDVGGSVLSMPNYAQDLVDFEYVFDEDDELAPESVNAAGIVVVGDGTYVGLAKITGRDWSIHTVDKKKDIVNQYQSNVLTSIEHHVQIVSLPTAYDIRDHIDSVNRVLREQSTVESEKLMNIGRVAYPNWLVSFMEENDMRERDFYLIVPLEEEQLTYFQRDDESLTQKLRDAPIIGDFVSRFTSEPTQDVTQYQCLRELNTRMQRLQSSMRSVDVEMDRITDRNEAMSVLYHYYNDEQPDTKVFPVGPFTTHEVSPSVGGTDIKHLLQGHNSDEDATEVFSPGQ